MLKKVCSATAMFFVFCFCAVLFGNESSTKYFPHTLGSYWVYEDQDGNEFTRRAVEGEEIAGETYHAFEYEPSFENWENYEYHAHPTLIKIDETGIKFHIGDSIKKTYKERITKEVTGDLENTRQNRSQGPNFEPIFDVEIENETHFYLLPFPITLNEEQETM